MFRRIVLAAAGAGLAVGLMVAALQQFTTTPLIVAAEVYENGGESLGRAAARLAGGSVIPVHDTGDPHAHGAAADGAWAPRDGIERSLFTALTSVLAATGFALMLLAAMVVRGRRIDGRAGLAWGACGFAAVALAPALGLAPELPGSAAAELAARQIWWAGTVAATAAGLALIAFSRTVWPKALAVGLIALPHAVGAPQPPGFASTAPAELAGQFAAASLVVAAVFWVALGWAAGTLYDRLGPEAPAAG